MTPSETPPTCKGRAMRHADTRARARAREALIWIERRFGMSRVDLPFLWSATDPDAREPDTSAGRDEEG